MLKDFKEFAMRGSVVDMAKHCHRVAFGPLSRPRG